ncbi:uncharacterized protein ISCGN_010398 [Ixodes scapularis]
MSESVAAALLTLLAIGELPAAAKPTADFLERMDKLFDCLNSSVVKQPGDKLRYAIKEQSEHASFLEQCLPWIESWRFGSADKRQPHTIKGWQVTIKAVLFLWGEVHQDLGFDSLLTRRLQQDALEKIFGIVRQQHGCNDNPTLFQFIAGLKHIMLGKLFKLSESTNCEDDTSFLLAELSTSPVSVLTTGSAQLSQASVVPLGKSFLRSKSADCVCERFLTDEGSEQLHGSHQFYSLLAANNVPESLFGDLTAPSDACYEYVQQLEARFLKKIDSLIHLGPPSSLHALEEEGTAPEMEAGMECSLLDTTDDDPPKVDVSADNEVPGPSHGGHRTPVVTPKKAGRRGRVFTPEHSDA